MQYLRLRKLELVEINKNAHKIDWGQEFWNRKALYTEQQLKINYSIEPRPNCYSSGLN
jgi:hypothetical protein